ncbi:30S ribosomal protein 2, chloroplastic [Apostasia shenzhenica]|uniref:30S ribosomal protein 2, chloroplastic n=1 Tax=Apostasia shenzhenica TaxID=1088818 RepID=A0A2I0ATB6_9ASPA|nr:30S ribosomal protein 2, chloroplastic [Apostasia shenzhenica]
MDPRTRESRGFAFVTMETAEDANRCIKYLNRSVLEGRLMVVEKVMEGEDLEATRLIDLDYAVILVQGKEIETEAIGKDHIHRMRGNPVEGAGNDHRLRH